MKLRRFHGPWNLTDLATVPKNGHTAFSCFHCGGGSTMGYKLAGFNVLGGVEIDPEMMSIYRANHKPKHSYLMGVQQFNKLPLDSLPDELKNLDLLDGSPPCSSFSMAGSREKKWGNAHHFREGQAKQVLDDLFFHLIEVGQRLQPKVIVAENVKGLILGNAKGYVKEIFAAFREAGYDAQLFLFNAARMGVPQARERTFFIARRQDLGWGKLGMKFKEEHAMFKDIFTGRTRQSKKSPKRFGDMYVNMNGPLNTLTTGARYFVDDTKEILPCSIIRVQSFPDDYNFLKIKPQYVMGMSVPPYMTQRVALEIGRQWFGIEYD